MSTDIVAAKNIVFTGAGFSKNFGGFLGQEMWDEIFNNNLIQQSPILRDQMLSSNFDFESIYSQVMSSGVITQENKKRMNDSVLAAYGALDDSIRTRLAPGGASSVNWTGLMKLMSFGQKNEFIFTLNQDLLMERRFNWRSPGTKDFPQGWRSTRLTQSNFIELENKDIEDKVQRGIRDHAGLHYIKLHGSFGWKSSDGTNQLVIGKDKLGLITKEPLLQSYFDLFESVIKQGNKKMLIIGYSFKDDHINKILLDGVQIHNLKIFVINPSQVAEFRGQIPFYARKIIDDGLTGYYTMMLRDMFPLSQEETVQFKNLRDSLV